jgi:hypothetical protein
MKKIILFKRKRRDEKDFEKFLERKGIINEKVEKKREEKVRWLRDLKEDTLVWLLVSGIFTLLLVVIEVFR